MKKYTYEFKKIKPKLFTRKPEENYEKIIKEKAREGWKLVQIFAPGTGPNGTVGHYELIFEKEDTF